MLLVGLGGDLEDEVADLELGSAEEGGRLGGDQSACDLEEFVVGRLGDGLGKLLGFRFLGGGEGFLHGASRMGLVDFSAKRSSADLCTKIPPNFETPTLNPWRSAFLLPPAVRIVYYEEDFSFPLEYAP